MKHKGYKKVCKDYLHKQRSGRFIPWSHCQIRLLHGVVCCAGTVIWDGAGYTGSLVGLSEEMMISLAETALYAVNFSNIVV